MTRCFLCSNPAVWIQRHPPTQSQVPVCHLCKGKSEKECKKWGSWETTWEGLPDLADLDVIQPGVFEVADKRFYLPGCKLSSKCPSCKKKFVRDFGEDYLSHPVANTAFDLVLYCTKCDHEWTVTVRLDVTLVLVGKNKEDT